MSDEIQSEPIMDGADDASNEEKKAGLEEQVEHDTGGNPSADRAGRLQERMAEADVHPARD